MNAEHSGHTNIVNLLKRYMATIRIQKRFKTRRKHRTQKAKQMSAFSRGLVDPESILEQSFRWNPNIIEDIGQHVKYYQNVMDRTRLEEQDEERMQLYTEWLQDRSQLGSGQRSKRRRRRNKSRRKYMY